MFNFKKTILCCLVSPMLSYAVIPSAAPFKTIVGDGHYFATTANSTGTFYTVTASDENNWFPIGTVPTSSAHMFYTGAATHLENVFGNSSGHQSNFADANPDGTSRKVLRYQISTHYGNIDKITSGSLTDT